jgi:hypothetical protein
VEGVPPLGGGVGAQPGDDPRPGRHHRPA